MTSRLEEIFSVIPKCEVFADIGCDHGLISREMLKKGKCENVVFSDVSEKCLEKARSLLSEYIAEGKATGIVSDGFANFYDKDIPVKVDCALIAGMGGEEIIGILCNAEKKNYPLPQTLVLQPMKNCDKVRRFVIDSGYKIEKDYVFIAGGKYYDVILLKKGKDFLTEEEIKYGRDNVKNRAPDFIKRIRERKLLLKKLTESESTGSAAKLAAERELKELEKYDKS